MVTKHLQAKTKHHYVWADYLKKWSQNGRDVYHSTMKEGNIAFNSVKAIAVEKSFYQIQYLHSAHIAIIKELSSKSPPHLQELHISYLADFLNLQKAEVVYKNGVAQSQELDKEFNVHKCNLLENLHASHENEAWEIISSLANRKIDILNDEEKMLIFMQFIGHQISRTKTFKDTILAALSKADDAPGTSIAKNMNECWWFLSYMFGMNIGNSLWLSRKEDNHCILFNDTDTPFITSDQPIINVHTSLQENEISPPNDEHCDFYYPISPSVAYMINKSDRFQRGINQVPVDLVNELNVKLARKANVYIVSNSDVSLKPLLKYVGQHFKNVQSS